MMANEHTLIDVPTTPETPTPFSFKKALVSGGTSIFAIAYYGVTTVGQPFYVIGSSLLTNFLIYTFAANDALKHCLSLKEDKKHIEIFFTLLCALMLAIPYGLITYLEANTDNKLVKYGAPVSSVVGSLLINGLALKQLSDFYKKLKNDPSIGHPYAFVVKVFFAIVPLYSAFAVACATDMSLQKDLGASRIVGATAGNILMLSEYFLSVTGGVSIASELISLLTDLAARKKIDTSKETIISWVLAVGIAFFSGYTAQKQLEQCRNSLMKPIGNFYGAGIAANASSAFFNTRYLQYSVFNGIKAFKEVCKKEDESSENTVNTRLIT